VAPNNITVIDQTTLLEERLLKLPIHRKEQLVFGYLGRFSKEKGIIELLKIFNTINEKLIVAGSGPLLNEVEKAITPNITLLGMVTPKNLTEYYKKIDVLIIPSFEEAGPLVGIEAMAAGKIILSTKVGAMEDRLIKTENNFWFDIKEQDSLKDLIHVILNKNDDQIVKIRKNVRRHYLENYSVNKISKSYINVFDKLLD
jgi:glycosyltransferase involved in cell wall biosynthesis